jgi:spermidine synthase
MRSLAPPLYFNMPQSFRIVLLGLFLCSGATALVYEVVWSKFLSQMLGSTVYAQTVVLAVFMGGLALGNRLAGKRADSFKHPVRIYGILEIGIGIYGCLFPQSFVLADSLFVGIGSRVLEHGWLLLMLKALFSAALLLLPTVLMGATLPLLASWLRRHYREAGRQSALFYSINTLGAVIGAGFAGFYLVEEWGLAGSVLVAGTVNLLVGLAAFLMDRVESTLEDQDRQVPAADLAGPVASLRRVTLIVAAAGGISMGLEVLASRSLALVFGSSLQSFSVVLIGFILGIGIGSTAIAAAPLKRTRAEVLIAALLCAAAVWVGLLIIAIQPGVELYVNARDGLARNLTGYVFNQLLTAGFAVLVLGVPAALIGSVLPLLIRTVAPNTESLAHTVGRLLTWNTCGAVGGVLLTGFVLMPVFGLRAAFLILALGLAGAAFLVLWKNHTRVSLGICGASALLLLGVLLLGGQNWRHVMSSGMFRWRMAPGETVHTTIERRKEHVKLLFYEDAPDATVTVEKGDGIALAPELALRINGKADASSAQDMCTQLLSGHLPLLARPDSKDVFILGVGSGVTAGAVSAHPITNLVLVDNCAPIFRAARHFDRFNRGVLTNPVTRARVEDARAMLKLSPQKYDALITEPSNPWTVGIGSVFTLEFYELAARRLKPGGIILQWFHIYENNDRLVTMVLRTVGRVFSFMEIWDCGSGDILIMASQQPWNSGPDAWRTAFERPEVKKDMQFLGIASPEALMLRQAASQRTAFAIAHPSGPIQTDMFPVLEYESPKAFFVGGAGQIIDNFDERTRQERSAPAEKRKIIVSLKEEEIRPVFANFASNNREFMDALAWHIDRDKAQAAFAQKQDELPSIVRPQTRVAKTFESPTNTTSTVTNALYARWLIGNGRVPEGVEIVEQLLKNPSSGMNAYLASQASFAAQACIEAGYIRKAGELLIMAIELAPYDMQLLYLASIVQREIAMGQTRKSASSLN